MATIVKTKFKYNGKEYERFNVQLPKKVMETFNVKHGDKLEYLGSEGQVLKFALVKQD